MLLVDFKLLYRDMVKSKSYYFFLTFPRPPHKSVVHEVMCRMVAAAEKHMPFILLVGDQPVYFLMMQLNVENPEVFSLISPISWAISHTAHSYLQFISGLIVPVCLIYLLLRFGRPGAAWKTLQVRHQMSSVDVQDSNPKGETKWLP